MLMFCLFCCSLFLRLTVLKSTDYCVEGFMKDSNRCVRKQSMMLCQGTSGTSSGTMTEERYQAIKTENEKRVINQIDCLHYFALLIDLFICRYYSHMKVLTMT